MKLYFPLRLIKPGTEIEFEGELYLRIKGITRISKERVNIVHILTGDLCYIPEDTAVTLKGWTYVDDLINEAISGLETFGKEATAETVQQLENLIQLFKSLENE